MPDGKQLGGGVLFTTDPAQVRSFGTFHKKALFLDGKSIALVMDDISVDEILYIHIADDDFVHGLL